MAGFKSKRMANGMEMVKQATWQDHLAVWEQAALERYRSFDYMSENIISDCMDQMQVLFPGNYKLVWHNSAPNEYHLTVKFEDPKHETLWRLKNT